LKRDELASFQNIISSDHQFVNPLVKSIQKDKEIIMKIHNSTKSSPDSVCPPPEVAKVKVKEEGYKQQEEE